MIHFEINKPWKQLKHLDFNCFIANQFMYLFLWRHFDINLVLLFKRFFCSARSIMYFSVKQRSHLLVPHLYGEAQAAILHFK